MAGVLLQSTSTFNYTWSIANSTCIGNLTNCTSPIPTAGGLRYSPWLTVLLSILAGGTSICTTIGNIMVVIAFGMEKSIRQPSNYLIASLAVTDILIGSLSMPLFTLYLLRSEGWVLGKLVCDLWLSLDYTVCLVSQYTVFLITLDRFCMVKVPAKYRNWRTKCKIKVMIAVTWIVPVLIFFTSIMGWHHFDKTVKYQPGVCEAAFQQNKLFSAVLVISYYWVTLVVMIVLYIGIYKVALTLHMKANETRQRVKRLTMKSPQETHTRSPECRKKGDPKPSLKSADSSVFNSESSPTEDSGKASSERQSGQHAIQDSNGKVSLAKSLVNGHHKVEKTKSIEQEVERPPSPVWKPRNSLPASSIHWDAFTGKTCSHIDKVGNGVKISDSPCKEMTPLMPVKRKKRSESICSDDSETKTKPRGIKALTSMLSSVNSPLKNRRGSPNRKGCKSENRARKALRTITFILGAFVLCWTPYHVVVLWDAFCPKEEGKVCVNGHFYEFSYWLCYMNSPINPFCYALSNQQFKKAFIKIMRGEYFCQRRRRR